MRISRHLVSGGLGIAGLALGSPAAALDFFTTTTSTYSYGLTGNSSNNSVGNQMTFDNTQNGVKITLTASAWNATKASGATNFTFAQAALQKYSGGLGVVSGSSHDSPGTCGTGGCNTHEVDNMGNTSGSSSIDFIRLDFDKAVILGGFGQTVYPMLYSDLRTQNGSYKYQYDDDYSVGVLTADPKTNVVAGLAGVSNLATIFGITDPNSTSCTGSNNNPCTDMATVYTKFQSGSATASKTWYVAASILSNYGGDYKPDGFKLASLTTYYQVQVSQHSAVPEPSSWMTMIVGFGIAGTALRRARHEKSATVAA